MTQDVAKIMDENADDPDFDLASAEAALAAQEIELEPETNECPVHGEQLVRRHSATKGPDPYDVAHLACGHQVTCYGPGEANVILGDYARRPRPRRRQRKTER